MSAALLAIAALGLGCMVLDAFGRIEKFWAPAVYAVGCAIAAGWSAAKGDHLATAIMALIAVADAIAAWYWWRRRKRRRAPRTLGAKARARIAAMTARMRERPSRPVLRPVPGGAR